MYYREDKNPGEALILTKSSRYFAFDKEARDRLQMISNSSQNSSKLKS